MSRAPIANAIWKTTSQERRFLNVLHVLEEKQQPFHWPTLARRLGVTMSRLWQVQDRLERMGYLSRSKRLALVECPVITNAGFAVIKPPLESSRRRRKDRAKAA